MIAKIKTGERWEANLTKQFQYQNATPVYGDTNESIDILGTTDTAQNMPPYIVVSIWKRIA